MIFRRLASFFLDILQVIVFAVAIFLFVYLLIMQPHKIKGDSMQPNFPDGEYLLTDKVSYRFNEPDRGDIIVFEPPNSTGDEFIKRIIALPGETVSLKQGSVYVNDQKLNEPYITREMLTYQGVFLGDGEEVTVPVSHYFVLGDNRPHSSDSRAWGFVDEDKVTGRAWVIYWPINKAGTITSPAYAF